jgi:predicted nucleic acid-binding Zn ribbon protein
MLCRAGCGIEVNRGKWCSDRCRMAFNRRREEEKELLADRAVREALGIVEVEQDRKSNGGWFYDEAFRRCK